MRYLVQQNITDFKAVKEVLTACKKFSPVVAVSGRTQVGKSLLVSELAHEMSKKLYNEEWDYEKYTCLSIDQFIEKVATCKRKIIVIEETANQLNKANWYDKDSKDTFFTLVSQAFRRNCYIFCMPHLGDVSKSNRLFVNYQFVVEKKYEDLKACYVKPQEIVRVYWDLKGRGFYVKMNAPMLPFYHVYTEENFTRNKEYTDWLEEHFKDKEIMTNIRDSRGLIEKKPEPIDTPLEEPLKIATQKHIYI